MKTTSPFVSLMALSLLGNLSAQDLTSAHRPPEASNKLENSDSSQDRGFSIESPGARVDEVPTLKKVRGDSSQKPVFAAQSLATLDSQLPTRRNLESVVDLDLLRAPSPSRKIMVSASGGDSGISSDVMKNGLAMISAVYRESGKPEKTADCSTVSLSVEERIKLDTSKLLEIVGSEVAANPTCVCEIVKSAIKASDVDVAGVVSIVEVTINEAPESMRIAAQCAIAAMPESIDGVQALLTKLDPNGGDSGTSSKSSKDAKDAKNAIGAVTSPVAALANPLDFPGKTPVPPNVGGIPLIPPQFPVIITPPVTEVNPR